MQSLRVTTGPGRVWRWYGMQRVAESGRESSRGQTTADPPIQPEAPAPGSLAMERKCRCHTFQEANDMVSGNTVWRPVLRSEMEAGGWWLHRLKEKMKWQE